MTGYAPHIISPAQPEYLHRLRFYRDEIKHQFNLLGTRSTILVTCQSFLVVPFAILNTASHFRSVAFPAILIAVLGAYTAWVIRAPIQLAHRVIAEWLLKQRQLLSTVAEDDYKTERDMIAIESGNLTSDRSHENSMAFSRQAPFAFLVFWLLSLAFIVFRAIAGF